MTIGETIRRLRKEKGLTQDALADALEISRQAVAKWESGKSAPATENLLKLAALLEVPLEELAGPKEQPSCALEEYARMQLEQERKKQRQRPPCAQNSRGPQPSPPGIWRSIWPA